MLSFKINKIKANNQKWKYSGWQGNDQWNNKRTLKNENNQLKNVAHDENNKESKEKILGRH